MASADIVIVGGGVIGSAIAWWLKAERRADARVVVIEPDPAYGEGSTGRSLGSVRQQFSTPENILISRFGVDFIRNAGERLGVDGADVPDVQFRAGHYVFIATDAGAYILADNVRIQRETGADISLLSPAELSDRLPWLNTADIAAAAIGERDEGWLDAYALLKAFRAAAEHAGVEYRRDRAVRLLRTGRRIAGVELAEGGVLEAGAAVNAAGPWAGALAATAGVELPVSPRKRTVFTVTTPEPPEDPVLLVDPSGVYLRRDGAHFLAGSSPLPGAPDPDAADLDPDYTAFDDLIWPSLAHRAPCFERLRMTGAWAGYYDFNSFDQNAILGPHPEIGNLYFANGFSGHGLQQAPAVGRALAEWILDGESRSLNLERFRFGRIAANRPVVERGVI